MHNIPNSPKNLLEVDSELHRLQERIASGSANSQTARIELIELLDERAKIVQRIAESPTSRDA